MRKQATPIRLSAKDQKVLESYARSTKGEQRMVLRSKIILAASIGQGTNSIARDLNVRPATVSKWRTRFAADGLAGLQDAPRPGAKKQYDESTEKRILKKLDDPPPPGHATWSGRLLSEALGDVSKHKVWRVLRRRGISLQRRRSWCISTDTQFSAKAAEIVGLYLDPPENAVVLSVDEKPAIQALERSQGYLKLPNGRAITGFNHEYKRNGTTTLFAALNIITGQVKTGHYKRRRRREFLDFMNEVVSEYPDQEIHVVLDNLKTHKPKNERWLSRHKNVHFHYTPTHASWLNQIECWFSILSRRALKGASFSSPSQLRKAIDSFVEAYNKDAAPFEWKKKKVHSVHPVKYYADLSN
jgi:transposase